MTICVDHDTGRLVWAAVGRVKKTLNGFFDLLGEERCAKIRLVSADAAEWIAEVVKERCENATLCIDAFHVVAWATEALDEVRREVWNEARQAGMSGHAKELKGCRYALWRNPEDLTARQEKKLAWIAQVNRRLYRAYLMKEQLRMAIRTKGVLSLTMLDAWLAWAQRCRIGAFVDLGRKIKKNIAGIEAAMLNNLSKRVDRVDEHQTPRPAPHGLRLQATRAPDRPRPPRPRWLLSAASWSSGSVSDPWISQESPIFSRRTSRMSSKREIGGYVFPPSNRLSLDGARDHPRPTSKSAARRRPFSFPLAMITCARRTVDAARASRESRFNPRPASLSWLAIVGATSRQFNNSIRSGNWSTARRTDSRRIGGSDINGLDSAPPAPRMAA